LAEQLISFCRPEIILPKSKKLYDLSQSMSIDDVRLLKSRPPRPFYEPRYNTEILFAASEPLGHSLTIRRTPKVFDFSVSSRHRKNKP